MRAFLVLCLLLPACTAGGSEYWFLPYEPDEHTLLLCHLDGKGDSEYSEGKVRVKVDLFRGAQRGAGKFGGGAVLNGKGAAVRCEAHEKLRFRSNQEFTVEMWVKASGHDASLFSITTRFYLKWYPRNRIAAVGYRSAEFPIRWFRLYGLPFRAGRWMHIALTHDSERRFRLYVNGELVGDAQHKDEGDYEKTGLIFFGSHDAWTYFLKGVVDEIRISDCVRKYEPLLVNRYYLSGETVKLSVDRLPKRVAAVKVTLVARDGKVLVEKTIPSPEISEELLRAEELPPENATIMLVFLDGTGGVISEVEETVCFVGEKVKEIAKLLDAARKLSAEAGARRNSIEFYVAEIEKLLERRRFDVIPKKVEALQSICRAVSEGETKYRSLLRKFVRSRETPRNVRISMSWGSEPELARDAFPWAERLGANELICSQRFARPEIIKAWKEAGYKTVILGGLPIHFHDRLQEHPEERQYGYWTNDPVKATQDTLKMEIESPSWRDERISVYYPIEKHWMVLDVTAGKPVPADRWEYDPKTKTVTISRATVGHLYRVYYMVETGGIGDPLYEPFAEASLKALDEFVSQYDGILDTYWFDELAFAYPGPVPQGVWDWESYTLTARPERQREFTAETGIAFDPRWMAAPPKRIDVPPAREYLRWMEWIQAKVKRWMKRATDIVHKHKMRAWLYWGDCHVGIEPYNGSLSAGGVDEFDRPSADGCTIRALVDVPEKIFRRFRVDWLFWYSFTRENFPQLFFSHWKGAKRGMLMKPINGIYWMTFYRALSNGDKAIAEDSVETIAEINDEFRYIAENLADVPAFTHDINLYVLNCWGKTYSWRPWRSPYLISISDITVRVRFISFEDVEKGGIPDDADIILNYGHAGSAWSGGYFWESEAVGKAVRDFIKNGGGFIGIQAPSYCEKPQPRWVLGDLFGLTAEGTAHYEPASLPQSVLAGDAIEGGDVPTAMFRTKAGARHWMARNCPAAVEGITDAVTVSVAADDVQILYATVKSENTLVPAVTARKAGDGRVVYFSGYSADYSFYRLLRRAIFWTAHREDAADALCVDGAEDVFIYAYPARGIIAVLNNGDAAVDVRIRCAPSVFGALPDDAVTLTDPITGERLFEGKWSQLSDGISVHLPPNLVRLLFVRSPD